MSVWRLSLEDDSATKGNLLVPWNRDPLHKKRRQRRPWQGGETKEYREYFELSPTKPGSSGAVFLMQGITVPGTSTLRWNSTWAGWWLVPIAKLPAKRLGHDGLQRSTADETTFLVAGCDVALLRRLESAQGLQDPQGSASFLCPRPRPGPETRRHPPLGREGRRSRAASSSIRRSTFRTERCSSSWWTTAARLALADRMTLNASISRSLRQAKRGLGSPATGILGKLLDVVDEKAGDYAARDRSSHPRTRCAVGLEARGCTGCPRGRIGAKSRSLAEVPALGNPWPHGSVRPTCIR